MASQDQLDELQSLHAIYDGSGDVRLELPELVHHWLEAGFGDYDFGNSPVEFQARIYPQTEPTDTVLMLRLSLPPDYLATEVDVGSTPPRFQLACPSLSQGQLGQLCDQLDGLWATQCGGPILFTWLEWLRTESSSFSYKVEGDGEAVDIRAVVISALELEVETMKARQEKPVDAIASKTCDNCSIVLEGTTSVCLSSCCHTLCSDCLSAVVQIHTEYDTASRCPLPQCRALVPANLVESLGCPELWALVSRQVLGTPFQDALVLCPKCEDLGMDMPVLTSSSNISEAADASKDTGMSRCRCAQCHLSFCGVCRSPCHPGEACLSDESRVVRMAKRRPPLPPELQDLAVQLAQDIKTTEKQRARKLAESLKSADFEHVRTSFLEAHEINIMQGLESIFGDRVQIAKAPIDVAVQKRFMSSFLAMGTSIEMRPAWHGTDMCNHDSIFRRGLLIPGHGNDLKMFMALRMEQVFTQPTSTHHGCRRASARDPQF